MKITLVVFAVLALTQVFGHRHGHHGWVPNHTHGHHRPPWDHNHAREFGNNCTCKSDPQMSQNVENLKTSLEQQEQKLSDALRNINEKFDTMNLSIQKLADKLKSVEDRVHKDQPIEKEITENCDDVQI